MGTDYTCLQCGKAWTTNLSTRTPIVCRHCKSKKWNKPKESQPIVLPQENNTTRSLDIGIQ